MSDPGDTRAIGAGAAGSGLGTASVGTDGPTIEAIHRDIALANKYRIELIKYLLAIAAALFAFTITYRPSLTKVDVGCAMWVGWAGLGISMIGGMFHMLGWDHYYKSYRDHDWKGRNDPLAARAAGKEARRKINGWRSVALFAQFGGFIVGVIGVGVFAAVNIDNVRKPDEHATAPTQQAPIPSPQQSGPPSAGRSRAVP